MKIRHKVLSTGYHHVWAVGYHHLFAQWPVNTLVELNHISHNGVFSDTQDKFLKTIQEVL